eukprot:gene18161-19974_t
MPKRASRRKVDYSKFGDDMDECSDDDFQDSPNPPPAKCTKTTKSLVGRNAKKIRDNEIKKKSTKGKDGSKEISKTERKSRDEKNFEKELKLVMELSKKQCNEVIMIDDDDDRCSNDNSNNDTEVVDGSEIHTENENRLRNSEEDSTRNKKCKESIAAIKRTAKSKSTTKATDNKCAETKRDEEKVTKRVRQESSFQNSTKPAQKSLSLLKESEPSGAGLRIGLKSPQVSRGDLLITNLRNIEAIYGGKGLEGKKNTEEDKMFTLEDFNKFYSWAESISDPRVANWFLIPSPIPTLVSVIFYLLFVKWIGPKLMESRQPFSLKYPLIAYNAFVMFLNLYILVELVVGAINARYGFPCAPVDYTDNPVNVRIAAAIWWYYFSKIIEFADTVFFVLRKRNAQISFLHVYHHATMPLLWWIGTKWVPGGLSVFAASLNSFVHVIMYCYYGLTVFGPAIQKYLWWKHYLTQLQLLQFNIALFLSLYGWYTECPFPTWMYHTLSLYMISYIILFGNFYVQAYIKQQRLYSKEKLADHARSKENHVITQNGHASERLNKKTD